MIQDILAYILAFAIILMIFVMVIWLAILIILIAFFLISNALFRNALEKKFVNDGENVDLYEIDILFKSTYGFLLQPKDKWLLERLENYYLNLNNGKTSVKDITSAKKVLGGIIKKVADRMPYTSLPNGEREIFEEMVRHCENKNTDAISERLPALANIMQDKNKSLYKNDRISRWSIPLSILGLILTIAFGLPTIFDWIQALSRLK